MRRGEILEGVVQRTDYPARGIVEAEGRLFEVKGTLEGQKVRFRVNRKSAARSEGTLLEILERAEAEQSPDCPHFPACGGCSYRTLSEEAQISMKREQIRRLFASDLEPEMKGTEGKAEDMPGDAQDLKPVYEGILSSPAYDGYRNKMEFTFGDAEKGGEIQLGMHERGSFFNIVTVDQCRIVDGDVQKILREVLLFARESGLPCYHRTGHIGIFRHLLIRKAFRTGEILLDLVTSGQGEGLRENSAARPDEEYRENTEKETGELNFQDLIDRLLKLDLEGEITGILHTVNDYVAAAIINDRTDLLYGRDYIVEKLLDLSFKITPFSFFQTNTMGAEVLYETVRRFVGDTKGKVIFDLYSGTGTIAQILAPLAEHVTGVEIIPEAVEAARENAKRNGLSNCEFLCGDVLKVVGELQRKPDIIVLDPPREGVNPKALPKILAFQVPRIVYISCKATSLKRDLISFRLAGYRLLRLQAVDLFPGTPHVETVVLLSKAER